MISLKAVTAIFWGATLCTAQTINISGTVIDTAGIGISGATVKLEVADISTTTGADGSFTLTNGSTQIQPDFIRSAATTNPIQIHNGMISFTLSENANVVISIHDVGGRRVYNSNKTYGLGTHAIVAPLQATGILIYKLNIGNETYLFKSSPFGTFAAERNTALGNSSALTKHAKSKVVISDVIAATKTGWLNYRSVIGNSDTSGVVIKMLPNAGDVTDADGNVYQSVRIGNQVWMTENLRVTKYNDGTTAIPKDMSTATWANATTPKYCYYNNTTNADSIKKFGALYNWYVVSPTNAKKIAPAGWHVPSNSEWDTLRNYLIANGYNSDGTITGNKIAKSLAAKTDWLTYSATGTIGCDLTKNNRSGFSALPGGFRSLEGSFNTQSYYGYWWSTTEFGASSAYNRNLNYDQDNIYRYNYYKSCGLSVRLLRD